MYLFAYVADLARRSDMNTSFISPLMTALMELQKSVSDLDKIATTPIPSAYSFHLRLTVWAYLFFLPFQIYTYIGWLTIPATAVASITYLGFLEIGAQIEMPFGYEQSDLDLDKFVLKITQQLAQVTAVGHSHINLSVKPNSLIVTVPHGRFSQEYRSFPLEPTFPPFTLIIRAGTPRCARASAQPNHHGFRRCIPRPRRQQPR